MDYWNAVQGHELELVCSLKMLGGLDVGDKYCPSIETSDSVSFHSIK